MTINEIQQSLSFLLHCVHRDNKANDANARLQYFALRILHDESFSSQNLQAIDFNHVVWTLAARFEKPAIRFLRQDVIGRPDRAIPGLGACLLLPDNTSLNSSSTLVRQAKHSLNYDVRCEHQSLGTSVRIPLGKQESYHSVVHLVCREPGKPNPVRLADALDSALSHNEVALYKMPIFGPRGWDEWVLAMLRLLKMREDLQRGTCALDLCYIDESASQAASLRDALLKAGIPSLWEE